MARIRKHFMLRTLPTILAVIGSVGLQAQVSVGIRGGVNWAKFAAEDGIIQATEARMGPAVGIIVEVPLSERLSLVPEFGFIQRGYGQEVRGGGLGNGYFYDPNGNLVWGYGYNSGPAPIIRDYYMVLDYVDLAALAKFHLGSDPVRPHLLAGVTAGWMTGARQYQVSTDGDKFDGEILDPHALKMNRLNLGLCGGVGFTFTIGASHLFAEVRYLYGLTNVWNGLLVTDINGSKVGELNGYDRSIQFTVGWMLPVAKRGNGKGTPVVPAPIN